MARKGKNGSNNGSRWKKNGPSPNPLGRPPKDPKHELFATLSPELASFLSYDRTVIGKNADGSPRTRGENMELHLFNGALKDPALLKLYIARKDRASEAERKVREQLLSAAIAWQDKHIDRALRYHRAGREYPYYPNPLDMEIRDNEVRIHGPATRLEAWAMKGVLQVRDWVHEALPSILSSAAPEKVKRAIWAKLRRRHYRLQNKVPPRCRKPFPEYGQLPNMTGSARSAERPAGKPSEGSSGNTD